MSPDARGQRGAGNGRTDTEVADFLRALRERTEHIAPRTALPELGDVVRQVPESEGLEERFTRAASAAGLRVHHARAGGWVRVLREILQGCTAKTVFVAGQEETRLSKAAVGELTAALRKDGIEVCSTPDDDTLFGVDAAITGVAAAIAETGTVVCTSGTQSARGSSLIPPVHVAVVGAAQVLRDLYDYFDVLSGVDKLPANVNLITGPSKTADIEGVLVTGVHGPGEVHVILVDD